MSVRHRRLSALVLLGLGLAVLTALLPAGRRSGAARPPGPGASDRDPLPDGAAARLGTLRFRSQDPYPGFLLSPDGKTLAVENESAVLLCDLRTGQVLRTLPHAGVSIAEPLRLLGFSPDGRRLATTAGREAVTVRVWDAGTAKELWARRVEGKGYAEGAFSAGGKAFLFWGVDGAVRVWDAGTGQPLRKPDVTWYATPAAVSPGGALLAACVGERGVRVWATDSGVEVGTLPWQEEPVYSLHFTPDGQGLAVVPKSGKAILLWDLRTGKQAVWLAPERMYLLSLGSSPDSRLVVATNREGTALYAPGAGAGKPVWALRAASADRFRTLALSPDARTLAVLEGQVIWLRDPRTGAVVRRLAGQLSCDSGTDARLAFSPDGRTLVARDGWALRRWSVATGEELPAPVGHTEPAAGFAFSASRALATRGNGLVHVWDFRTGEPMATFRGHEGQFLDTVALSPDGKTGASCDWLSGSTVRVWDVAGGRQRYAFGQPPILIGKGTHGVALAFSPDGKTLAVASVMSPEIDLRDAATGRRRVAITLPGISGVDHVAFSPDGKTLAVGWVEHQEAGIDFWDAGTGLPTSTPRLPARGPLVFSPDGKRLATRNEHVVRLWEVTTGRTLLTFRRPGLLADVAFTPSGRLLALEDHLDGPRTRLDLWDVSAGKKVRRFEVPGGRMEAVALSPDGGWLATAMWDTSVLVWDLRPLWSER